MEYHLKIKNEEYTANTDQKFLLCDVPDKCYVWNKIYKTTELNTILFLNLMYFLRTDVLRQKHLLS